MRVALTCRRPRRPGVTETALTRRLLRRRAKRRHRVDRIEEPGEVGLGEHGAGAGLHHGGRLLLHPSREPEHGDIRMALSDRSGGLRPSHVGHLDVHHDDIGWCGLAVRQRNLSVLGFSDLGCFGAEIRTPAISVAPARRNIAPSIRRMSSRSSTTSTCNGGCSPGDRLERTRSFRGLHHHRCWLLTDLRIISRASLHSRWPATRAKVVAI